MATSFKVNVSAKLTVVGSSVKVRTTPQMGAVVRTIKTGTVVQATERAYISGDPWFHISDGWISGNYVQGWVKDYNNNNSWWYVEKDYSYTASAWKTIEGKDYCFGKDSYLFVSCYIKAADGVNYYWVDDDGVWQSTWTTSAPDRRRYRIVENYATINAFSSGSAPAYDKVYAYNTYLTQRQMKVNAQYILNYLRARGWTKNAVCGMLGNMQTESTISPGRWQNGDEGNMKLGFGLTMWSPASKFLNWADERNLYPVDMDSQLQRILFELTTTDYNEKQWYPTSEYNYTFPEFTKSTKGAYDLAAAFLYNYEKAKDLNQIPVRGNQAIKWYGTLS